MIKLVRCQNTHWLSTKANRCEEPLFQLLGRILPISVENERKRTTASVSKRETKRVLKFTK